jgi:hypothetical protein
MIIKMSAKNPKSVEDHIAKIKARLRSTEVVLVLKTRTKNQKTERNFEKDIEDTVLALNKLKRYRSTRRMKESAEVSKVTQVGLFLQVTLIVDECIFKKIVEVFFDSVAEFRYCLIIKIFIFFPLFYP